MSLTLYRVSAFPKGNTGGNEAGVVLDTQGITETQMLKIAKRVNYSETAFVLPSEVADYKLRYFSPTVEVPLCGHATIATFNLMRNLDMLTKKHYTIETQEGILDVYIFDDHVTLQMKKPKYLDTIKKTEVASQLGIDEAIILDLPVQVVSTGIKEIFMGIKNLNALQNIQVNTEKITKLAKQYGAVGIYMFTFETLENSSAHGRNFIPLVGIEEESATGTASGALACYLNKYHDATQHHYVFEQGYTLYKPSKITVELKKQDEAITAVYVGGTMRLIDKIVGFMPDV